MASAKGLIVTWCCGPSESKRPSSHFGLPIMNVPPGMATIAGQSAQSLIGRGGAAANEVLAMQSASNRRSERRISLCRALKREREGPIAKQWEGEGPARLVLG